MALSIKYRTLWMSPFVVRLQILSVLSAGETDGAERILLSCCWRSTFWLIGPRGAATGNRLLRSVPLSFFGARLIRRLRGRATSGRHRYRPVEAHQVLNHSPRCRAVRGAAPSSLSDANRQTRHSDHDGSGGAGDPRRRPRVRCRDEAAPICLHLSAASLFVFSRLPHLCLSVCCRGLLHLSVPLSTKT